MTKRTFFMTLFGGAGFLALAAQIRPRRQSPMIMNTDSSPVAVRLLDRSGSLTDLITVPRVVKSEAAWRAHLTDEQFRVTRTHGTERAFCGIFHDNHKSGVYTCIGCGLPLFRSDAKFDSGTGWPSFFQPVATENIGSSRDESFGMIRTEIHCVRCYSHLGHVFDDGPKPNGLRYCINSVSLDFREDGVKPSRERIIFGAGCFWGVEATFGKVTGVTSTRVGYSGGTRKNPTYEDVCAHGTGHAEAVEVEYDPERVSIGTLLDVFWNSHNPTGGHRRGADEGSQYRSTIFFTTPEQETAARTSAARLEASGELRSPITTEILLATTFYPAEEYHQKYHAKHGIGTCRIP